MAVSDVIGSRKATARGVPSWMVKVMVLGGGGVTDSFRSSGTVPVTLCGRLLVLPDEDEGGGGSGRSSSWTPSAPDVDSAVPSAISDFCPEQPYAVSAKTNANARIDNHPFRDMFILPQILIFLRF
jgi:hypothetical protein